MRFCAQVIFFKQFRTDAKQEMFLRPCECHHGLAWKLAGCCITHFY